MHRILNATLFANNAKFDESHFLGVSIVNIKAADRRTHS